MSEYGVSIKPGVDITRIRISCRHQNGLLYVVPSDNSWVCSAEYMHAHSIAGFFREVVELDDSRVDELMQKWGLYFRPMPLEDTSGPSDDSH